MDTSCSGCWRAVVTFRTTRRWLLHPVPPICIPKETTCSPGAGLKRTASGSLEMQDAENRQKIAICAPPHKFVGLYLRNYGTTIGKKVFVNVFNLTWRQSELWTTSQRARESNIQLSFAAIFRCDYVSTRRSSSSLLRNEGIARFGRVHGIIRDVTATSCERLVYCSRSSRRHTEFTDIIASSAFFQSLRGQREAKCRCKKSSNRPNIKKTLKR